ncbi:MAG: hypothetical protein MUO88_20585, partial [Desulfobacterales bacterium]|nr:hypothetical protein [Desulfobacterales bacterium]
QQRIHDRPAANKYVQHCFSCCNVPIKQERIMGSSESLVIQIRKIESKFRTSILLKSLKNFPA